MMKDLQYIKLKFALNRVLAIAICLTVVSCKKSEDRKCFKGAGEYSEIYLPLDEIRAFNFGRNIKYRIYQDDGYKAIIKGGENLIGNIEFENIDDVLYLSNSNKCEYLRDSDEIVEVEIHYPDLTDFYIDATDSVIFANQIESYYFRVEMRNGGGSLYADVDVHTISMVVSHGAGDFTLEGKAKEAELKIQNNGTANAIGFRSVYTYIFQNSTADLYINLDNSSVGIFIDGTGDVFYNNTAANIILQGVGSGQLIKL